MTSGIGSGIGSIFGAPLGGAVLATEILYRDDFEVEALLPSFIASIVGYAVWGSVEGFGPLFGYVGNYHLTSAKQLFWFGLIGVLSGLVGLLYAKGFYGMAAFFGGLRLARWLRPAIGGFLVGCVGLAIPEVLGTGYGWIQVGLGPQLLHIPLWIVLVLPFAHILTTGLSIGSGGSGGIFGPGMVIGAFLGAAVWRLLDPVFPSLGHNPAPYVIVGMMACFGSISRAPLAVMLMVAEMTGTLSLLIPAMVAVGLATLIVRRDDDTIYRSQLRSRAESPAHRILTGLPVLAMLTAAQTMAKARCVLFELDDAISGVARMTEVDVIAAPLVDPQGHYIGVVTLDALVKFVDLGTAVITADLVDSTFAPILETAHLDVVLETFTSTPQTWAPVIDEDRRVLGTIAISDIVGNYRRTMQTTLRHVSALDHASGIREIVIQDDSALVDVALRSTSVPRGALIIGIERGRDVLRPSGDTVLTSGDQLMVLGTSKDLDTLGQLAGPRRR